MRVRAFTNRGSTTKVIGKFPSQKTGKTVWWESQIERDLIYLLEFDSDVIAYREQPIGISYELNGKRHIYTPDFLVQRRNGQQIIEVKPESEANKSENVELFNCIRPICQEAGYRFIVVTDLKIRKQPLLNNIKLLWRYSRTPLEPRHFIYCYEMLLAENHTRLADAFAFFDSKGTTRAVVYALLYRGALGMDHTQVLGADTLVFLPHALPTFG
jgi:hypothetical protein